MNMKYLVLLPMVALLSACGGGSGDATNTSSTTHGAGGLFFGAYAETAGGTDAESAVGGLYLQLPSKDADFNGRMSFQYKDCQNTNALKISGEKLLKELTLGRVEGLLDPVATDDAKVFFGFSGSYGDGNVYGGKYERVGTTSNQARTAAGCLSYMLAYKGQWVAWPQGSHAPADFQITQSGSVVQWPVLSNMSKTVVMFLDPSKVTTAGADALVLQRIVNSLPATTLAPSGSSGKTYRVVVQAFDATNRLIAYDDATMTF